jgi:hypothetical protein
MILAAFPALAYALILGVSKAMADWAAVYF